MAAWAEKLDTKLRQRTPETAEQVRQRVAEIIALADQDALDVLRSRMVEQEVLDILAPPQPGEVWLADLGLAAKMRPVVIVSCDDPDPPRALILYVPLTTRNRQSPYEVVLSRLGFLDRNSVANVQGLGSLPRVRLERRLGKLPDDVMTQIKRTLAFALDLGMEV